jgi:hypothetical protein
MIIEVMIAMAAINGMMTRTTIIIMLIIIMMTTMKILR